MGLYTVPDTGISWPYTPGNGDKTTRINLGPINIKGVLKNDMG